MKKAKEENSFNKSQSLDLVIQRNDQLTVGLKNCIKAFEESTHIAKEAPFCFFCVTIMEKAPIDQSILRVEGNSVKFVFRDMCFHPRITMPAPKWGQDLYVYNNKTKEHHLVWCLPEGIGTKEEDAIDYFVSIGQPELAKKVARFISGDLFKEAVEFNNSDFMKKIYYSLHKKGLINFTKEKPKDQYAKRIWTTLN
jgi:hypothetical protein